MTIILFPPKLDVFAVRARLQRLDGKEELAAEEKTPDMARVKRTAVSLKVPVAKKVEVEEIEESHGPAGDALEEVGEAWRDNWAKQLEKLRQLARAKQLEKLQQLREESKGEKKP